MHRAVCSSLLASTANQAAEIWASLGKKATHKGTACEFAVQVRQAELFSMKMLDLKVPYLERWAGDHCPDANISTDAESVPPRKRQRMQEPEAPAAPCSMLETLQRQLAAQQEAVECKKLHMQMEALTQQPAVLAQQRALLAQQQIQADTPNHRQAAEGKAVATSSAAMHLPNVLLNPSSALPPVPANVAGAP